MKTSIAIVLQLSLLICYGQPHFSVSHLSVDDGLAHNNVYELFQDSRGYIWIGAGANLHRYDGNRLISYQNDPNDPNSLPGGDVRTIFEDVDGSFWIGTDGGGLTTFENGVFSPFSAYQFSNEIKESTVEQIIQAPNGELYIGTWGDGVIVRKDGIYSQLKSDPLDPNTISSDNVVSLYFDENRNRLWIGTWDMGLCYLQDGKIHRVPIAQGSFNSRRARVIHESADGTIWIGSWGDGLFTYKDGRYRNYSTKSGHLDNDNVLTLQADGNDLWVGTWGGGITLIQNTEFNTFRGKQNNKNSIQSDFIESFLLDRTGSLWIGTFGSGITKLEKNQFKQTRDESFFDKDSESTDFVRDIIQDQNGRIWVAGFEGIKIHEDDAFIDIQEVYPDFPSLAPLNTLFQSRSGDIWIGGSTQVGLHVFDGNKVIDRSVCGKVDFRRYFINSISETFDGKIVISADVGGGLHFIEGDSISSWYHDPSDSNSLSSSSIFFAKQTLDSTLWIGTTRTGLNSYKNGKMTRFPSVPAGQTISNNYVYDLVEGDDGSIWIGTESGLNQLNRKTGTFKQFFDSDGLIHNAVMSLQKDASGNIWMGTQSGISRLNPSTLSFQNFGQSSGLRVHPFQRASSFFNSESNELYFGGVNGMVSYHPDSIDSEKKHSTVVLTDLLINHEIVFPNENGILKQSFEETNLIEFRRFEGSITIEFSTLDYGSGANYQFAYQLNGYDPDWKSVFNTHEANYNNLPPGSYQFLVKSSSNGIDWSEPTALKIAVLPFWWETTMFYILCFLLGAVSIFYFVWRRNQKIRKQKRLLEYEVMKKTKDLKEAQAQLVESEKMASVGFLTAGIAHEINNPLNYIHGSSSALNIYLQNRLSEEKEEFEPLFDAINMGIERVEGIVKSLNHFNRGGTGEKETCDINEIISNCLTMLRNRVKDRIEIHQDFTQEDYVLTGLEGKLHQVMLNVLVNAIQAIEDTGTIWINTTLTKGELNISVKDTGVGIKPEDLDNIVTPFYTTKDPGEGTGLGLSITYRIIEDHGGKLEFESTEGIGTTVHIKLPVDRS